MKNGIILEIKKDKAIVVNKEGNFDAIKYKNGMKVGQEVKYSENSIHKITRIAAVFVVGIVSFATITTYNIYNTPTTYIAFGSSSNVEFTANSFGRVISTNIKNQNGKPMPNSTELLNKDITEACVTAMKMANQVGFIDSMNCNNVLDVVIVNIDEQYIDNISKKIHDNLDSYFNDMNILVQAKEFNDAIKAEAIEKNIDLQKMYLIQVVKEINNDLSDEIIENMSISELNDIIKKCHIESLKNGNNSNIEEFKTQKEDLINKNKMLQSTFDIAN